MCVSVGLSVKYVVVWSISLLDLCILGSCVRGGALGLVGTRNRTFCVSAPLSVCLSSRYRYLRPVLECARGWRLWGFDSPAGLWLRLLLLLARDVQSAVPSLRSSVVLRAVPPPLGVRCALFSVFVGGAGRFSGVNKIGRLFGGASPSGFAFGLANQANQTN